jgi:hypothetical protein
MLFVKKHLSFEVPFWKMQNTHYKGMSGSTFVSGDRHAIDVATLFCQEADVLLMWLHFYFSGQKYFWCGSTFVSGDIHTVDVAPRLHQEDRHTVDVAPLMSVDRQKCYWCGSTFVSGDRHTVDVAPLLHQEDRHTVDVAIFKDKWNLIFITSICFHSFLYRVDILVMYSVCL